LLTLARRRAASGGGTANERKMTVTLKASTGATILVRREEDMFAALPAGATGEAQVCLGIDLFEVVAELAGLDLDEEEQAEEATRLANDARQRLSSSPMQQRSR
jgi:hypothetical protein